MRGRFDGAYNSQNIEQAYGTEPDLLVYAGLRAEKYLANSAPEKDLELIVQAEENIEKICPKKLVLISTIDVFKNPQNVDENTPIDTQDLHAYGYNRYMLECWVREHYVDALIIRLPALFGPNIKKNFIYDYINRIPYMLKADKFLDLVGEWSELSDFYQKQNNNFYKVKELTHLERCLLRKKFMEIGFSALNFTDSRSRYQFYPLSRLWKDIQTALENDIRLWHPATEPVSAGEIYQYLEGESFVNELSGKVSNYNYKTIYDASFHGTNGYIMTKEKVLYEISQFVESEGNVKC